VALKQTIVTACFTRCCADPVFSYP
jgi:hypothetical protein